MGTGAEAKGQMTRLRLTILEANFELQFIDAEIINIHSFVN